jgi:dephospho-CoA kinase
MLRVGLTGGLGAGKSTALARFAALGAYVFSADEIGRAMMQPGEAVYAAIIAHFGTSVVSADGLLDRPALARIAFGGDEDGGGRVEELNAIVHPAVIARQTELLDQLGQRDTEAVAIVESALIFETKYGRAQRDDEGGFERRFDKLIFVRAAPELKIARFVARTSGQTAPSKEARQMLETEARRRIARQIDDRQKAARCDFILSNDSTISELESQVDALWAVLKAAARLPASVSSDAHTTRNEYN